MYKLKNRMVGVPCFIVLLSGVHTYIRSRSHFRVSTASATLLMLLTAARRRDLEKAVENKSVSRFFSSLCVIYLVLIFVWTFSTLARNPSPFLLYITNKKRAEQWLFFSHSSATRSSTRIKHLDRTVRFRIFHYFE